MRALRNVGVSLVVGAVAACAPATKTAADVSSEVACVSDHWGQTPEAIALACFNNELSVALDVIADEEALLESKGAPPTAAYKADARVAQIVLAKLAKK